MLVAKLRACSIPDAMKPEQKVGKPEKEGHDSLDNFIRQAVGKEPFLSFSRAGESPVQWIQLLQALDQQGTNKLSKGLKVDNAIEGKEHLQEHCNGMSSLTSEVNGVRESTNTLNGSGVPLKVTKSTNEHMQTLKIPEAVVAFAQAAAKANDLPGWPLLSPLKVQMQKCEKCSREFYSPINYRRHIRVHRRSLNIDKDSPKNREFLGAFWDKLSLDEMMEIVSFKNVALEEVAGSSILRALTSFIRKPGFSSLPQAYIKAGVALLDVVQARPSGLPISSQELFLILDDASEKTFLCAGTAISMQKFVFDGEAGKIALEMKNLVACMSFLVEQKLVKAWVADKDAEALKCQKLLVEEEEAARKRRADLLEKRRLKKLRQKEQKVKEQTNGNNINFEDSSDTVVGATFSEETSSPHAHSDSELNPPEAPSNSAQSSLEPTLSSDADIEVDGTCHMETTVRNLDMVCGDANLSNSHNSDPQEPGQQGSGWRHLSVAQHLLHKQSSKVPNGFHLCQVPLSKSTALQKHGNLRDQRSSVANTRKVWIWKAKLEREGESSRAGEQREPRDLSDQTDNCEVLIGSISVALGDSSGHCQDDTFATSLDRYATDQPSRWTNLQSKPANPDSSQNIANKSLGKYWRPVGCQEVGESAAIQSNKREAQVYVFSSKTADRSVPDSSCLPHDAIVDYGSWRCKDSVTVAECAEPMGPRLFSSHGAVAFLAQRWKDAISSDHVNLVLFPESEVEPPDCQENVDSSRDAPPSPSSVCRRGVLGSAENRLAEVGLVDPVAAAYQINPNLEQSLIKVAG